MDRADADRAPAFTDAVAGAIARIAPLVAAPARDADPIQAAIAALAQSGALALPYGEGPDGPAYALPHRRVLEALVGLGGTDLNVARLFEGHLNALQVVSLYATRDQRERVRAVAEAGGLLGVWGADGTPPVAVEGDGERIGDVGDGLHMAGAKRYASGLGLVHTALVPFHDADRAMRLALVEVHDAARMDPASWDMRGMQGSRSGAFDFEGITLGPDDFVGAPGDYVREPWFVGGIWRCAAAHLGAIERIVDLMAGTLQDSGRIEHPLQLARVGEAMMEARTARLWIEDAAARVEGIEDGGEESADGSGGDAREARVAQAVAISGLARLRTESAALAVMTLAERSVGLPAFAAPHPIGRMAADLRVYLRQANPDALLLGQTRALLRLRAASPAGDAA